MRTHCPRLRHRIHHRALGVVQPKLLGRRIPRHGLGRRLTLPAGSVGEPFVDLDDLADVAVAALTEDGHEGEIYEVTGPRLLTFADVASELAQAVGRDIAYQEVSQEAFVAAIAGSGAPEEFVQAMDYLFSVVMDGRNSYISDGVIRALGRPPKDFTDFASEVATTELWRKVA